MPQLTKAQMSYKKMKANLDQLMTSPDPKISAAATLRMAILVAEEKREERRDKRDKAKRLAAAREKTANEPVPEPEEVDPFAMTPEEAASQKAVRLMPRALSLLDPAWQIQMLKNKLEMAERRQDNVQVALIRQKLGLEPAPPVTVPLPAHREPEGTQEGPTPLEIAQEAEERRVRAVLAQNPISEEEDRGRALQAKRTKPASKRVREYGDDSDVPFHNLFERWPFAD